MTELLSPAAAASPSVNAIDAVALSKRYGRRWALRNVGFSLPAGATLLLAGHNGSGKSTLLRILATASRPDRGTARVAGVALDDVVGVRHRVALLGHYSFLYDALTARENLGITARLLRRTSGEVEEVLARVGLGARGDDPVSTFSAGMRKRLSLARVLLQHAAVVLLDEPYGALDPSGFTLIDEVVRETTARGATVVMATHQLERSASLADFALVLNSGEIEWHGPAAGVVAATGERRVDFAEASA